MREQQELDRVIDVTVRQHSEDAHMKPTKFPEPIHSESLDRFLEKFPIAIQKTAIIYSKKPSIFMKAEHLALARLYRQANEKLQKLGLEKSEIKEKMERAKSATNRQHAKICNRPKTAPHRFLEWGKPFEKKLTQTDSPAANSQKPPTRPKAPLDKLAELFDVAKMEYKTKQLDHAERHLMELLKEIQSRMAESHAQEKPIGKPPFLPNGGSVKSHNQFVIDSTKKSIEKRLRTTNGVTTKPRQKGQISVAQKPPSNYKAVSSVVKKDIRAKSASNMKDSKNEPQKKWLSLPSRPKSARPSRSSKYPTSSEFSDIGSEAHSEDYSSVSISGSSTNQASREIVQNSQPPDAVLKLEKLETSSQLIMEANEKVHKYLEEIDQETNVPHSQSQEIKS
jgi:hypothetical protein